MSCINCEENEKKQTEMFEPLRKDDLEIVRVVMEMNVKNKIGSGKSNKRDE